MFKNYFYILSFLFCMISATTLAQDGKSVSTNIDGLNFYPNPVSNGKIYVTSKLGLDKEIAIFDVLGKKVLQTVLTTKELNLGNLQPGVYIIKFKENEATATRKLIVK
jgi:small basic protein